jgi:ribosomal protein L21E
VGDKIPVLNVFKVTLSRMTSKYSKGSKVLVTPGEEQLSLRDAELAPYAGKTGVITDCYSIQRDREVFYLYTVRIDDENKEVVLHEDELKPHL